MHPSDAVVTQNKTKPSGSKGFLLRTPSFCPVALATGKPTIRPLLLHARCASTAASTRRRFVATERPASFRRHRETGLVCYRLEPATAFHGIPFQVTPRCGKYRPLTSSGPKNRTHAKRELERTRQRRRASMDAVCATRPGSDHAKRDATRRYRFVRRARNRSGPRSNGP